jgi:DNA polymerase III alpha subunit
MDQLVAFSTHSKTHGKQGQLFTHDAVQSLNLPQNYQDWKKLEKLNQEFNALGFYVSSHPLDAFLPFLTQERVILYQSLGRHHVNQPIKLAGVILNINERVSAKGNKFAFLSLMDQSASYELLLFSELLTKMQGQLILGSLWIITATGQYSPEGALRLTAHKLEKINETSQHMQIAQTRSTPQSSSLNKPKEAPSNLCITLHKKEAIEALSLWYQNQKSGKTKIFLELHFSDEKSDWIELPNGIAWGKAAQLTLKNIAYISVKEK